MLRPLFNPSRCVPRKSALKFTRTKSTAARSSDVVTWTEYLAIRHNKRMWQTVSTIPCVILGFGGGIAYFGTRETDALKPIFGIDPFFFYGICTVACGGFGWLVGPSLGTAIWRMTHRRLLSHIDSRDREFYARIAKNRVDASLQTPTQPVPDYYGEKIGSLHQYRQWLRDQTKYKRRASLPEE
ncbi:hypothetical protein AX14_003052 [Amanita brunnescens Koide BX004]|nr:hypothetical protein AX14_003052 [Amanita brunnescens Koide BX004]